MSKTSDAVKVAIIGLIGTIVVAFIAIIPKLVEEKKPSESDADNVDEPTIIIDESPDINNDDATAKQRVDTVYLVPPTSGDLHNNPSIGSTNNTHLEPVANETKKSAPATYKTEIKGSNNGAVIQGESIKVGTLNFAPQKDTIK